MRKKSAGGGEYIYETAKGQLVNSDESLDRDRFVAPAEG